MRLIAVFVSCSLFALGQGVAQSTLQPAQARQTQPAQPHQIQPDQPQQDWRFAHPDALLVGSIHPKALIESPLIDEILKQTGPRDASGAQTAAMLGLAKGLLSGINEIRFSLSQTSTNEPGTSETTKAKTDFVALVDGQFDESVLKAMMAGQAATPGKVSLRRIDANTLLIGQGASLDDAAQRMTQSEPKLRSRAFEGTETLVSNDFWISGQIPENPMALLTGSLPLSNAVKTSASPDLTKNLRRIAMGLSLRDGIDAELVLKTTTPEMAEALVKEMLKSIDEKPNPVSRLIGARAEGATAYFTLDLPRSMAVESIRAAMDQQKNLAVSTTAPQPLEPPKPVHHAAVIQGLDEGPREVPLPQQTH